jgi:hypothetical protein
MEEPEVNSYAGFDGRTDEVIVRKRKGKIMGTFSAISKLSNRSNNEAKDIFDLLDQMSKGALHIFRNFKYERNENNNLVHHPTKEYNRSKQELFNRYLRELRKLGIVRKAPRRVITDNPQRPYEFAKQTYIINPYLIKCWEYEEAAMLWDRCKP